MNNWKNILQDYLPTIEKFLTSLLLEETHIEIAQSDTNPTDDIRENLKDSDIFLYTRDETYQLDVVFMLDEEWYGLLSSIMLGVEEKTRSEVTVDLLKKFSGQLSSTLVEQLQANDFEPRPSEVEVLTRSQLENKLVHGEYFWTKMQIEGLADDTVRAELLLGNPDAQGQASDAKDETDDQNMKNNGQEVQDVHDPEKEGSEDFSSVEAEDMEQMGSKEQVISGRYIEFEEFDDQPEELSNGNGRSMDLLKDVEMDVSVELGRIELPLGKVLQLSKGSVLELEKLAGEPVDILVNGHPIAHGEVVVIDEHFGVRISNLVTTKQRIAGLE